MKVSRLLKSPRVQGAVKYIIQNGTETTEVTDITAYLNEEVYAFSFRNGILRIKISENS